MIRYNQQYRDRLASDSADHLDQEAGTLRRSALRTNPFGAGWHASNDPHVKQIELRWGRVADVIPTMNGYRVQGENGQLVNCTLGGLTGFQPSGARSTTTLPVGCGVYYAMHPQSYYGLIISVDPEYVTDPRNIRNDFIVQGGRTGIGIDKAHYQFLQKLFMQGGMPCFNGGRPGDSTSGGEWGVMTETGLALHLDPFLSYMRVDEETGLFLFYHDQLTRLSGHNLQLRSALGEREELDDQQESISISGYTPYHFEAMGAWDWNDSVHKELESRYINRDTFQGYSYLEPKHDDQQPWYRVQEYGGYLGQGGKKLICLPPLIKPNTVNRYRDLNRFIGVFEEHNGLDGSYALQSAKRVYIGKRSIIPVPKMVQRPESPLGDNESNYKAAGLYGPRVDVEEPEVPGEVHKPGSDFAVGGSSGPEVLVRAAAILDLGALVFNWHSLHPFHYHRKDWYVPEEGDNVPLFSNQIPPQFCSLQSQQYLDAPVPLTLEVDHRHSAKYYSTESYITLLDDGGVCIGDGFGAEIRMTGGSVNITAPGDINVLPGKNANVWAGHDAIIKAHNSADVTANKGDVRLKAQHDVQILGGNDQKGGVLIESKATCAAYDFTNVGEAASHAGIVLVSRSAPVLTTASEYVLRTKAVDGQPSSGNVRIHAGDGGEKDIKLFCNYQESFLKARFDFFENSSNEFWDDSTQLGSETKIKGKLLVADGISMRGWLLIADGHVSTEKSSSYEYMIPVLPSGSSTEISADISEMYQRDMYLTDELKPEWITSDYEGDVDDQLELAEFSLRTVGDYRTTNFTLFESRWQQLARLGTGIPAKWTENPVNTASGATYAHPGKEAWITTTGWKTQNLKLHNVPYGASLDRAYNQASYEQPSYGVTNSSVFQGQYPIIIPCKPTS